MKKQEIEFINIQIKSAEEMYKIYSDMAKKEQLKIILLSKIKKRLK